MTSVKTYVASICFLTFGIRHYSLSPPSFLYISAGSAPPATTLPDDTAGHQVEQPAIANPPDDECVADQVVVTASNIGQDG